MAVVDLKLFGSTGYLLGESAWGPSAVTGPDKVAQRFLYALMTPAGSVPGRPDDGTEFITAVRTFRSEFDLFAAFAAAEPIAGRTVRAAETTAEAASEKYGYARLALISVEESVLTLTFAVVAADGSIPTTSTDFTTEL